MKPSVSIAAAAQRCPVLAQCLAGLMAVICLAASALASPSETVLGAEVHGPVEPARGFLTAAGTSAPAAAASSESTADQAPEAPDAPPRFPTLEYPETAGGDDADTGTEETARRASPALAPAFVRVEEDDPDWIYGGSWTSVNLGRASGGSYQRSATFGSSAELVFNGSWISLGFIADRFSGEAEVFIDGVSHGVIDLYRNGETPVSFLIDDLPPGTHSLVIQVLGTSNPLAANNRVQLDYVDYGDGSLLPDGEFEEDDDRLLISNGWVSVNYAGASGGSYLRSFNGTAWFPFAGDSFSLHTMAHIDAGRVRLYVDGVYLDTIYPFAPVTQSAPASHVFSYQGLGEGPHVLTIKTYQGMTTIDKLASPGSAPFIDPNPPVTGVTRFEADHPSIRYNGLPFTLTASSWVRVDNISATLASAGEFVYSAAAGDTIEFDFDGDWLGIGFVTDRFGGQAEIAIDGVPVETIDLYTRYPDTASRYFRDLGPGPHTVSISVLGTRHPNSIGARVHLDFFDVWDGLPLPEGRFEEDDERLIYSTAWGRGVNPDASGGAFFFSRLNTDSTAWFPFTGDSVTWEAFTNLNYVDAELRLNGVSLGLFELYTYDSRPRAYSFNNLGPGPHVLEVRRYRNTWVSIDAMVTPATGPDTPTPTPAPFVRLEENYSTMRYNDEPYRTMPQSWSRQASPQSSGGFNLSSTTPGDVWRLEFEGEWINLGFRSTATSGTAEVFINGVSRGIIETANGVNNVRNFTFGNLGPGPHGLEVVVISGAVMPDYVDVWDGRPIAAGWYEPQLEDAPSGLFAFNNRGSWRIGADIYARNGDFLLPHLNGTTNIWLTFSGNDLSVLGYQRNNSSLHVVIDGVDQGLFDMSTIPPFRAQPTALHFPDLGAGPHVVQVAVAAARIDAFEVDPDGFFSYMPEIIWYDTTGQETLPGATGTGFLTTVAIGDLNGDGVVSLVAPGVNGRLYVYRGDGQDAGDGTPIQWTSDLVGPAAEPALADLTGDGKAEIVVTGREGTFAFRHDGQLLWSNPDVVSYEPGESFGWGGPSIGNLDLGPEPEIVVSAYNGDLYVLDHQGDTVFSRALGGRWPTVPLLADITGDGILDIVVAHGWTLEVIDYFNGGETAWSRTLPDPIGSPNTHGTFGGPAVADLTGDGRPEIIINWGHVIEALRDDGSVLWRYETNRTDLYRPSPITVADVTGDGQVNLVTASAVRSGFFIWNHLMMVLDHQGNLVWEQDVGDTTASASGVAAQDLTGNGAWEILWNGSEDGFLIINGADGKRLFNEPWTASGTIVEYPTLADVTGNGEAEIVTAGRNGIFVIGHPGRWVDSRPVWNQHHYHINNINNDWSIPFVEENSWQLHNTYRTQSPERDPACATIDGIPIPPRFVGLLPGAGTVLPAGTPLVLSGRVIPVNAFQPVLDVWIDERPVDLLDASGSFFATVELATGVNVLQLMAADRCGPAQDELLLVGGGDADDPWSDLGDASMLLEARFAATTHDRANERLLVEVQAFNPGSALSGPVLMAVGGDADPSLGLLNADGFTPQGEAYAVIVPAGETLAAGSLSPLRELALANPQRGPIDFTPRWIAPVNQPPYFTSVPDTRANQGQAWDYVIGAADGNGDPLSFALLVGPAAMSLSGSTLSWTPAQTGNVEVLIEVSDGRGGTARQGFTLQVVDASFNSPPVFVSTPVVQVSTGASYHYAAAAVDADGDPLSFSLSVAPTGMQVDATSGHVSWALAQPGQHSVVLRVEDGRGGEASQAWTLFVGQPASTPAGPAFASVPPGFAAVGTQYRYVYSLNHGGGAAPLVSLVEAPATMQLDPTTRLITWVPGLADLGTRVVELLAVDGNGLEARQRFELQVLASLPNQPPYFVSTPVTSARIGALYQYAAEAIDPEFQPLSWSLANAPAGMTVDAASGLVSWVPTAPQPAQVAVSLQASDPQGAVAKQSFQIQVRAANSDPVISANPPTSVMAGQFYSTRILASDADGDPLSFRLLQGPPGMTLHPAIGWLNWNTVGATPAVYPIALEVVDGWGGRAEFAFQLTLLADLEPPSVTVLVERQPACRGESVRVCVEATDNVGISTLELLIDGQVRSLDPARCHLWTPPQAGLIPALAEATDPSGLTGTASRTLQVADCNDEQRPVVTLFSPLPDSVHNQPVPIVVSIDDDTPQALTWTVELIRGSAGEPVLIAQGSGPVAQQAVATFDPTALAAGDYRVRVIGSDGMQTGGIEFTLNAGSGVKPGRVRFATQDVGLSLGGFPLSIGRSYDSLEAGAHGTSGGDLGPGWHFSLNASVSDSARDVYGDDFASLMLTQPYDFDTRVYVTRPDGVRVGFSFDPVPASFPALGQYDVNFRPDPGVTDRLRPADGPDRLWNWGTGFLNFIIPYNPSLWELETREGVVYLISETQGLLEIRDVLGGVITVSEDGIVSSWGPSIDFGRDAEGRVIEILLPPVEAGAPRGRVQYGYDESGNLVQVTDLAGGVSTFEYSDALHPHHLTALYDQLGHPIARMIFDDEGRMIAHCPADGDIATLQGCSILGFDSGANLQTVFDPRGFQTQRFFDERGLIILQRDWYDGAAFAEQAWTWDEDGNLTRFTDAGGNDTLRTFDPIGNELSRTLPDGTLWQWGYGDCPGQWTSFTDPQGNIWQREYSEACELLAATDPLGGRIEVLIESGQPVQKTDAIGETRRWQYTAQNLLSASLDERGAARTYEYNGLGQVTRSTNRNAQVVEFDYDDGGRMVRAHWPDSSREIELSYSAVGQLTETSGPDGTQRFEYWPTGQLRRVAHSAPGGPDWWVEYEYDLSGNVAKVTDSAGGITEYEYNGLNQMTAAQQRGAGVLEKRVEFEVNPAGLLLEIRRYADLAGTDPGPRTVFEYGCSSCITSLQTIRHLHADGSTLHEISMVRDERGRVVQRTDNSGVHDYLFDGRAWLIEDSDGVISWDGAGNWLNKPGNGIAVLSYSDDSGHLLLQDNLYQYSYDAAGLMTERTALGSGEKLIFERDLDLRLAGITRQAGNGSVLDLATYSHSPQGWRVGAAFNGTRRHYVHDGQNPIVALDDGGNVVWRRLQTRVLDRPLAEERGGQIHWLLTDHIGSVREAVPHGGVPVSFSYDAWGRQLSGPPPSLDDALRYSGREFDLPAGLGYYRARTYLPDSARFAEPDPQAPWHYAYVHNDPVNLVDPTGEVAAIEYAALACKGGEIVSLLVTMLYALSDQSASDVAGSVVGGIGLVSDFGGAAGGMGSQIGGTSADFFSQVMGLVVDGLNGKEVAPDAGLQLVRKLAKNIAVGSFVPDKCGLRGGVGAL